MGGQDTNYYFVILAIRIVSDSMEKFNKKNVSSSVSMITMLDRFITTTSRYQEEKVILRKNRLIIPRITKLQLQPFLIWAVMI